LDEIPATADPLREPVFPFEEAPFVPLDPLILPRELWLLPSLPDFWVVTPPEGGVDLLPVDCGVVLEGVVVLLLVGVPESPPPALSVPGEVGVPEPLPEPVPLPVPPGAGVPLPEPAPGP
jgi:hypothetical protein